MAISMVYGFNHDEHVATNHQFYAKQAVKQGSWGREHMYIYICTFIITYVYIYLSLSIHIKRGI